MTAPSIKHDELMYLLADHLRGGGNRMVWTDMQIGPVWSPRPDVWTLDKSYVSPNPRAYECKISREDFRSDVTKGKWQDYLRFSRAVTFVTPAGLIDKKELPQGCGLMTWNGTWWRTVKAPTLQVTPALPRDAMMKLLIDGVARAEEASRIRLRDKWVAEQAVRKRYGDKVAEVVRDLESLDTRIAWLKEEYARERRAQEEESRRQREERKAEANAQWVRLCQAVGVPEDSNPWHIEREIDLLLSAVDRDKEVRELRKLLEAIDYAVERAKKSPNAELRRKRAVKSPCPKAEEDAGQQRQLT